jgi:hypothetical protein
LIAAARSLRLFIGIGLKSGKLRRYFPTSKNYKIPFSF